MSWNNSFTPLSTRTDLVDGNAAADVNQLEANRQQVQANVEALKGGTPATAPTTDFETHIADKVAHSTTWVTSTTYTVGNMIVYANNVFLCVGNHTSGTFTTDWLTNSYWHCVGDNPGDIKEHAGTTAPPGYLECDGSAISRTTYELAFANIGTTWGVGDGSTTFNLPDLRGVFLRGTGSHGSLTMADGNPFAGPAVGASENDQVQGHYHDTALAGTGAPYGNGTTFAAGAVAGVGRQAAQDANSLTARAPQTDGTNGTPRDGDETRPVSYGVLMIINI